MLEIFREVDQILSRDEPFALATVVRTKGSTPQKPGSKLLVRKDGTFTGTLGGGCVEADAFTAAKLAMEEKAAPEVHDFTLSDELARQDGLVCGGSMEILIDRPEEDPLFNQYTTDINNAYRGGQPVALAVLTDPGNTAATVGSKLLIREDGSTLGTLGGPTLDLSALDTAREMMDFGRSGFIAGPDKSEMFIEAFTRPPTIVIAGAGHIALSIYRLARFLNYQVVIVDDRPEFANRDRFPEAHDIVPKDFAEGIRELNITPNTFIIVATRGHKWDDIALLEAARTPARYVGLLGSKRKAILIYQRLYEEGIPHDRIQEIRSPVGLNFGGRSIEEIALSIVAEIEMLRHGGDGSIMKMSDKLVNKARDKAGIPV
jgi:xanthine dehydrogenase accessory factor